MRSALLSFTLLTALAVTPAMAQMQQGYGAAPGNMTNGNVPNGAMANPNMPAEEPAGPFVGGVPAPPSHQPMSRRATNINRGDTRSLISPSLPAPPVGANADATQYLQAAQNALSRNRTGEAQAALENAETFLLNRSVPQGMVNQPDQSPAVRNINGALQALAEGDRGRSMDLINQAIPLAQQYEAMTNGSGVQPATNYGGGGYPNGNGSQPGMNAGNYPSGPGIQNGMQPPMQPGMNGYQGNYQPRPGMGGQPGPGGYAGQPAR